LRDVKDAFYLYEVEPERLRRQLIGPRLPLSWFSDLHNEDADVLNSADPWCIDDLLDPFGSRRVRFRHGYTDYALAGVMMGDLNAVTAIQVAHRRQLIAAGALHPESLLLPGRPFPTGDIVSDVYIDDLAFLVFAQLMPVTAPPPRPPLQVERADALYRLLGMPTSRAKAVDAEQAELWGASVEGRVGTAQYAPGRRATLFFATILGLVLGMSKRMLQALLGGWNFAAAFRPLTLSALGLIYQFVEAAPPQRRLHLKGPARDDLLLVAGLAPLMVADLRAAPWEQLYAVDASPTGAGACASPLAAAEWDRLFAWAEERGEYVRLDWGTSPPPSLLADHRGAAAGAICGMEWKVVLSHAFVYAGHINLLELEALTMLIRQLARRGCRDARVLVAMDSRVSIGAVTKGRSSSRKVNYRLRKLAGICLGYGIFVELIWVPTWANPGDAPSRFFSLEKWRASLPWTGRLLPGLGDPLVPPRDPPGELPPPLPRCLGQPRALDHLELLAAPLSETACRARAAIFEELPAVGPPGRLPDPVHVPAPVQISARWDEAWRDILLLIAGDVHPHPGPRRRQQDPRREIGPLDVLVADVLPITVAHYDRAVANFELWLRPQGLGSVADLLAHGITTLVQHTVHYLRAQFSSVRLSAGEVGNLVSGLRRIILLAQSLGADIPDPAAALRPLWRLHRSWVLSVPSEFRLPIDFRLTLALALQAWTSGSWPGAVLILLGFHCLLRPGEMVTLSWDCLRMWSPAEQARYADTYGLVRVVKPKTRRMVGHSPVQHVLIEDAGLASLLAWVLAHVPPPWRGARIWRGPDYRFATHFAGWCRALGLGDAGVTPAGLRGGGATDYWISCRNVPAVRRRGRWTSERTLERYLQEGGAHDLRARLDAATLAFLDRRYDIAAIFFQEIQVVHPYPGRHPSQGGVVV